MKELTQVPYDACRWYVTASTSLSEDEKNYILGCVRSRNYERLANVRDQFEDVYRTSDRAKVLMQVEAFFKKNACFDNPDVTLAAAYASFEEAESLCRRTNRRLSFYYEQRDRLDPDLSEQLDLMSKYISSTLGPARSFLRKLPEKLRVTDGASAHASRRRSRPHQKVSMRPYAPSASHELIRKLGEFLGYRVNPRTQNVNRVEFVPKSFKTRRTIACEPVGVLPCQLACDSYIKSRLRKRGIDLSDQTRNQEMAKQGSIDGSYATVDLSMASDTVALSTILWLFPYEWCQVLLSLRTPYYQLPDGRIQKYAKFSSMGNGVTFGLESLLFAAACRAVGARDFVVYGDDIVIENHLVERLYKLLKFLGFLPNEEKSYHGASPFRESCGGNYFNGTDITPFYIRDADARKAKVSRLVNGLVRCAADVGCEKLLGLAYSLVRDRKLHLVPYTSDLCSGVHVDVHSAYKHKVISTKIRKKETWLTPHFKGYTQVVKLERVFDYRTLFLWYLRSHGATIAYSPPGSQKWETVEFEETSLVPTFSHKYVRKWIRWNPAEPEAPLHLYWWGDFLNRQLAPVRGSGG